jgi:transcription antitermination factor NusG
MDSGMSLSSATLAAMDQRNGLDALALPECFLEEHWYAAYTSANHERRVAKQLCVRRVEHFLPTYSSVRRWKDRRVTLELPLFPGYVFVRLALRDRVQVLQVPGVARLVGFNGLPTALPENEIKVLKAGLADKVRAEPHRYLTVGQRVRVKSGPLAGLQGILLRRRNRTRLVVSVELIQRAMAVEVDETDLGLALS